VSPFERAELRSAESRICLMNAEASQSKRLFLAAFIWTWLCAQKKLVGT
jgi:hypothetical protein